MSRDFEILRNLGSMKNETGGVRLMATREQGDTTAQDNKVYFILPKRARENIQAKLQNQRPRRHQQHNSFKNCILNSWAGWVPCTSSKGCFWQLGLNPQSKVRELLSHAICLRKSPGIVLVSKKQQSRTGGSTGLHLSWKVRTDVWECTTGKHSTPRAGHSSLGTLAFHRYIIVLGDLIANLSNLIHTG